jgi:tRNA-2-methylthio-N6-dimethylallyladenosine synthase
LKRVFIKTYGCQMNERDSEAVAALLGQRGYALARSEREADVILLNTCSVRDLAEQKAFGKMGVLGRLKRQRPDLVLGYLGCMAQSRGAALAQQQPVVDLVVGTQRLHHVPEYLDRIFAERAAAAERYDAQLRAIVDVAEEAGSESAIRDHVVGANGERPVTGFVSIMQGCEMFCSFCIVPYTRGPERSRSIAEIVTEVEGLAAAGVKEVTLLGQIVTSYGRKTIPKRGGKSAFVQLLEAVHAVPGLQRIRFTAPHPKGFGEDLVAAYRQLPKLCEYAHLPVQSGSDRILKAMKRGYSRAWFEQVVAKLRAAQPAMAISTDIIVGYPGETEADFAATVDLVRTVEFDQAFLFKYSPRRDTPAAELPDDVPPAEKERRHQALLALVNATLERKHAARVGQTVEVLVEGRSAKGGKRMFGRTRRNEIVVFDGADRLRGALVSVKITGHSMTTLYGEPVIP